MSLQPLTGAKRLRELLKDPNKLVVCPGVYDGITARIALSVGFDALYMVCAVHFHRYDTYNVIQSPSLSIVFQKTKLTDMKRQAEAHQCQS